MDVRTNKRMECLMDVRTDRQKKWMSGRGNRRPDARQDKWMNGRTTERWRWTYGGTDRQMGERTDEQTLAQLDWTNKHRKATF